MTPTRFRALASEAKGDLLQRPASSAKTGPERSHPGTSEGKHLPPPNRGIFCLRFDRGQLTTRYDHEALSSAASSSVCAASW
jgi:hypothetical protein